MNKCAKIASVLLRLLIQGLDYFDARRYMRAYNWYLKRIGVDLNGVPRYIHPSVDFDGKGYDRIHLGDHCVISKGTLLLVHDYSVTCALRSAGAPIDHEAYFLKDIRLGNNCFVGANVTLLPGTSVGDDCIIGAGSVVKGKVESGSIVAGNPARVIARTQEWALKKAAEGEYLFEERPFRV